MLALAIFVVTLAIFCLGILFVAYMARRKHEEIAETYLHVARQHRSPDAANLLFDCR